MIEKLMHFLSLLKAGWKALSQGRLEEGIWRDKSSGRRGRGGKTAPVRRNVEGQKEQRMKFHSGLKQPTMKGAGRLAVPSGLLPVPLGLVLLFLEATSLLGYHF